MHYSFCSMMSRGEITCPSVLEKTTFTHLEFYSPQHARFEKNTDSSFIFFSTIFVVQLRYFQKPVAQIFVKATSMLSPKIISTGLPTCANLTIKLQFQLNFHLFPIYFYPHWQILHSITNKLEINSG